ncbi:MAG: putative SigmaB asociated two-component system sensor protein, partial [Phycisphaerales bacterium]|nr:putative SigmaB asociated two-component system sensor protein [Phycisphaerales bacterium]
LALTSKYKSEFLANMSHELRTPLNSLLILSDQLSKNGDGNLTVRQVEFARTIHSSGNDLLALINDILDLSKIESGTVIVDVGDVTFRDLADYVDRTFRHVAESKKLDFHTELSDELPRAVHTDSKRLQQILKNLLSNAFKFTDRGHVALRMQSATQGWSTDNDALNRARTVIAFSVSDTGIGIPPEKQQIIFEAFQQADGSTSRKYGGTGLGLAISRELAKLLGGEIRLTSGVSEGSIFTLYLPQSYVPMRPVRRQVTSTELPALTSTEAPPILRPALPEAPSVASSFTDDSADLQSGDRILLVVENDPAFARFLFDLAHENNFKAIVVAHGAAAISVAREIKPHAITLDINLPDIDGWRVLNRLKDDAVTRHIPVHLISTEEERERGLRMGAMGALVKPVKTKQALDDAFSRIKTYIEPRTRKVLVTDGDEARRKEIAGLCAGDDAAVTTVPTAAEALAMLREQPFDLVILEPDLPDMKGFDLVDEIRENLGQRDLPLILYSTRELSKKEELHLKRLLHTTVLRDVRSAERLLDDVSLFLHRNVSELPDERRGMLEGLHSAAAVLAGKKVLVVDDDIRNIFAMTSILEPYQAQVFSAETGKAAIETLQQTPDMDVVLMDIMMPDMDGYDTMRAIRKLGKFRALPIIALTAKAMKGDREKCIEAGASDYISKPVDTEQLLGLLRVWLYR